MQIKNNYLAERTQVVWPFTDIAGTRCKPFLSPLKMRILTLLLGLTVAGCSSNIAVKFDDTKRYIEQFYDPTSVKAGADKSNTSVIFFTHSFTEEPIEFKQNGTPKVRDTITTIDRIGLSRHVVVSNIKKVRMKLGSQVVIIHPNFMKKYKFIYVSKNEEKYIVEYSNKTPRFM